MADTSQEKTEEPTARRLAEARREGNIPKSMDLTAAFGLLVGILLLELFGSNLMAGMKHATRYTLSGAVFEHPVRIGSLDNVAGFLAHTTVTAAAPVVLGVMFAVVVVTICQVGFVFSTRAMQPSFSKMSPLRGMQNILGARGAIRLIMSLSKVTVLGAVAVVVIFYHMPNVMGLAEMDVRPLIIAAWTLLFRLGLVLSLVLILLAIFDYAFQRHQTHKELRMSKQDVKDEMKQMDGDPQVKQRRARVARQLAMQRLNQAVPGADVIVTNPTHFAVALKYDGSFMAAPKVVAKGADYMALRIRQLAMQHEVPIVERKTLARGLFFAVEVGQQVPPQFFAAVAEILAYVYRLSGRKIA